jgi:sugar phosphate isomerase/epimerase
VNRILSVSTAPFDGYDLSVAVREISRLGIEYVEPAFIQGYTDPFGEEAFSPIHARKIKSLLEDAGVFCFALSAHMDLASEKAVDFFKRRMEFAHQLGARVIVTNAAATDIRELFLKNIATLAKMAESLGLVIGLENPGDGKPNLVNGGADGAALIREIGSEAVRLNYDFGNVISHFFGRVRPEVDYRDALPFAAHLHIKDVKASEEGWFFTGIGQGSIDYASVLRHLGTDHDSLPISIEIPLRVTRAADASPRRLPKPLPLEQIRKVLQGSVHYVRTLLAQDPAKKG